MEKRLNTRGELMSVQMTRAEWFATPLEYKHMAGPKADVPMVLTLDPATQATVLVPVVFVKPYPGEDA